MRAWATHRWRGVMAIASIAVAVVVIGGVTLPQNHSRSSLSGSSAQVVSLKSAFNAVANVSPPVVASRCLTPMAFTYSGTVSATAAGTVRYRWVYSAGKPGPVETLRFTRAGNKVVSGATIKSKTAGGGWGQIKMTSPVAHTSNKAMYKLLCGGSSAGGITVTAAVQPTGSTINCTTASPAFTATGSITANKAERVSYYWAQSNGANSAPAALTFTKPGTQAAEPLAIKPPAAPGSGAVVLVVTSPVTAASSPATYAVTCQGSTTSPTVPATASAPVAAPAPASSPPPPQPTSVVVTVNASATAVLGQPYSGTVTVSGGDPPYTWSAVSGLPPGLTATANGATLTISGTPTVLGNWLASGNASDSYVTPQTTGWDLYFTVVLPPITITVSAPATATVGQPYEATVTATGGDGSAFTWSVTGIPLGLTGIANGGTFTISGTPTEVETYQVDVTVSDSQTSFSRTFDIVVSPAS